MSRARIPRLPLFSALALAAVAGCSDDRLPTEPDLKAGNAAPLMVDPAAVDLLVPGAAVATLTARVQFVGLITATSSDAGCAVVTPASVPATKPPGSALYVATFTVTAVAPGSCTVTVRDKKGREVAVPVTVGANVVTGPRSTITALTEHVCGLTGDGRAYCWGRNDNGQLGDGTSTSRFVPTLVPDVPAFRDIAAGDRHTCAVAADGQAYCWGDNLEGELGNGTTTASLVPVRVSGSQRFVRIAAGTNHTCALTAAGAAWCWGGNYAGEVGDGSETTRLTPVAVTGGHAFASLVAGEFHSCGITTAGQSLCWGSNFAGQIGDGTADDRSSPTAISGGLAFASLAGGRYHACGVTTSGAAYCWGNNAYGEIGIGSLGTYRTPQAVVGPAGGSPLTYAGIAAGIYHACGRVSGGGTYCWGQNASGEIGDGTFGEDRLVPTAVSGAPTYAALALGQFVSCGLRGDGAAFCWGNDVWGKLGDGAGGTYSTTPVAVAGGIVFATP